VDLRVVVWVKEFLLGRSQRVSADGQLSYEARITSGVPQAKVLFSLLFLAYVNDIWRNTEFNIRLFADDCIIYRKITDSTVKPVLNGISRNQNIFPLKTGFRLIKVHYI